MPELATAVREITFGEAARHVVNEMAFTEGQHSASGTNGTAAEGCSPRRQCDYNAARILFSVGSTFEKTSRAFDS